MTPDAQDSAGNLWRDDPSIPDDEVVYRRIPRQWYERQDDGSLVIASGAFDDDVNDEPMSVYLESSLVAQRLTPADTLDGHAEFGLAAVTAGALRAEGMAVCRDPLSDERTPHKCDAAHGVVVGKKSTGRRKRIRRDAYWVIEPA